FAGALFGSLQGSAGPTDFLSFQSLPVLLLAMIGGVTTVTGALIGGLLFASHAYIPAALAPVFYLGTGASAVLLGRNSNGLAGEDSTKFRAVRRARLGIGRTFQRLEVFGSLSVHDNLRVAAEAREAWGGKDGMSPSQTADAILERIRLAELREARADALPTGM